MPSADPSEASNRTINPCRVFDLELQLSQAAEGYRAMNELSCSIRM